MPHPHTFDCHLVWTGASKGTTTDYEAYGRSYRVEFAGKPALEGSAAPPFRGDASLHNPEDLLVAALSACHCLSYLALCARAGIEVVSYEDDAHGVMTVDPVSRKMKFRDVVLKPVVVIAAGDRDKAIALHHQAHDVCFIASSVNFPVTNEPTVTTR